VKHIRLTVYPRTGPAYTLDALARSTCDAIVDLMDALGCACLVTARVVRP